MISTILIGAAADVRQEPRRPGSTGMIFDIKQYAIHDGPGIRTTVFFKGCPLACWWCHNPEGIARAPQIVYRRERCIGCLACVQACPQSALGLTSAGIAARDGLCKACGSCAAACPAGAREMAGRAVSVEDVMETVKKDILFYDESGGGVTFSGGEPLMQPGFLLELLRRCGRESIHRAVDTCGQVDTDVLLTVARETDLFLFDLKMMDPVRHRQYTGVSNELILTNLKRLARFGAEITVRIPLIPGINDGDDNIDVSGMFLRVLPRIRGVHLLPYHDFQKKKYACCNIAYPAERIQPPTEDRLASVKKRLEAFELQVDIGG